MFDLILRGKLSDEAVSRAREDTLTATALAPIAYGPARVRSRFLTEVAGTGSYRAFELRFWPWLPLAEGKGAEPDALGQGPGGALLVEAKAGTPFTRAQLEREGSVARRAIGRRALALLTISDRERPRSLERLVVEASVFQATFVRELLDRTLLPAVPIRPDRDKVTRARALAARYEAGKVFHLRSAPGLAEFEDELVAFPNGRSDDQVDAAVYGADLGAPLPTMFPIPASGWLRSCRRGSRARLEHSTCTEGGWRWARMG